MGEPRSPSSRTQRLIARLKKQDPETAAASLRHALKTIADQILDAEDIRAGKGIFGQHDKTASSEFMRARRLLETYY